MQSVPGNLQFNIPVQGKPQTAGTMVLPTGVPGTMVQSMGVPQAPVMGSTDSVTVPPLTLNLPPGVSLTMQPLSSSTPGFSGNPRPVVPATMTLMPKSSNFVPGNVQLVPANIPPTLPENVPALPGNVPTLPENVPAVPEVKTRAVLTSPLRDGERIKILSYGGQNDGKVHIGNAPIPGNEPQILGNMLHVPQIPGNLSHVPGSIPQIPGNVLKVPVQTAAAAEEGMPPALQIIPIPAKGGNVIKP